MYLLSDNFVKSYRHNQRSIQCASRMKNAFLFLRYYLKYSPIFVIPFKGFRNSQKALWSFNQSPRGRESVVGVRSDVIGSVIGRSGELLGPRRKIAGAKKIGRGACKLTRGALSHLAKYNAPWKRYMYDVFDVWSSSSKCESSAWKRQNSPDVYARGF